MRAVVWALVCALLAGCASLERFVVQAGLGDPVASAEKMLARGEVMEARKLLLSVPKDSPHYARARRFLRRKVDPARLKLIRKYRLQAEAAEQRGMWMRAAELYAQSASFSIKPDVLIARKRRAELKGRIARMLALAEAQDALDASLLQAREAFAHPPRALAGTEDPIWQQMQARIEEMIERHAERSLAEAKRLKDTAPEIAWIEITSFLRFEPDSETGQKLAEAIRAQLPDAFTKALAEKTTKAKHAKRRKRKHRARVKPSVQTAKLRAIVKPLPSVAEVRRWIEQGKLLQAKRALRRIQREGPDKEAQEAKKLLGKLEAQMKKAAEAHYEKGRVFFAKEQLDKAIAEWEQAAKLAPDNQEYAESLRRARLLKERLELLRQAASEPAPAGEEEAVGAGQ